MNLGSRRGGATDRAARRLAAVRFRNPQRNRVSDCETAQRRAEVPDADALIVLQIPWCVGGIDMNWKRLLPVMAMLLASPASRGADAPDRPNILFAIADDASWPHMSAYGCKFVKTPNFDRVAREGILFNNAFTSNPKCSPSRASILTGRSTWQLEEACDHFGIFPSKFKVYPDLLEASGYFVGFTAKGWAPGDFKAGGWTRNPAGKDYSDRKLKPPTTGISRIDYAANFQDFLRDRKPGQPFCFWFGCHEPHRPYELGSGLRAGKRLEDVAVPPYLPDDAVVRSDLLDYAVEVEWFDQQLGLMLKTLEERGELENTLVVVTSDNGMPFPRVKGQIYDDDFHLPLAVRWGKRVPPGRAIDDFVSFTDFAPTFLAVAGLEALPEMTGRSFLDLLKSDKSGRIDPKRDRVYVGKERHDIGRPNNVGYPVRAIRTTQFLYARNFEPDRWPAGNPETGYRNIDDSPSKSLVLKLDEAGQSEYWRLSMGKRPLEELYDLQKDPHCMQNLIGNTDYEKTRAELWEELRKKLTEENDPRILGHGDVFDHYPYVGKDLATLHWDPTKSRDGK
jgi:N-sulfoglucosamine sulfohydrolase